jgi:hypothetical protein
MKKIPCRKGCGVALPIAGRDSMKRFIRFHALLATTMFLSFMASLSMMAPWTVLVAEAQDFSSWTESPSNPLFGGSASGVNRAYYPSVIKVGAIYHIWYGDGDNTRHASSTHADFSDVIFPAPTVTGLSAGAYHPRVLYNSAGWTIGTTFYTGPFLMYSTTVADWTLSPRVAYSADGNSWTDIGACTGVNSYSSNSAIYNFDVLYEGGTTWKAYADNGSGDIEYYTSTNGIDWTGTAHNILGSPLQPWETWFTSPHVIKVGSSYIIYYGSGGTLSNQGIGMATSTDGQNFTKNAGNPIFSTSGSPPLWRDDRTYTPYVMQDGMGWLMYYSGRNNATGSYSIGYTGLNSSVAIPTLTDWGMIIFLVPAGLGSVYYLRKQRRTES